MLAELLLGRPLLPREIVHHRDGDSTNNASENLLVLPSQRYHAHAEFHMRRQKTGMPSLFPELFQGIKRPPGPAPILRSRGLSPSAQNWVTFNRR
ncbi:HNH endonuclease [Deinococcus marmoris]|uniref:HNH endonuclease n=1 Tax=Deinococcus marmoris TaxID=249408 RepID=UPI001FDF3AC1|nr:HNH endonuclease [Deinococcus marmoris]